MRRKKFSAFKFIRIICLIFVISSLLLFWLNHKGITDLSEIFGEKINLPYKTQFQNELKAFAEKNNINLNMWRDDIIKEGEKNPEIKEFILNYPLRKNKSYEIDLSKEAKSSTVPELYQWDKRWGYKEYAGELMGFSGCSPTCLSMVSIYLHGNSKYNPSYVADLSIRNGYAVKNQGTSWSFIPQGGKLLGIDVVEIPLVKSRIFDNLKVGNPIICVMGPGDFTTTGHFIVMAGTEDGLIKINDPYSPSRTHRLWKYEDIENQIKNLWVCR